MTEKIEFTAENVQLTPESGYVCFWNAEHYFWLQPGEAESALSIQKDQIRLERDDEQFGGSGSEWTIALARDALTVYTSRLPAMACDEIKICFQLPDDQYAALERLLRTVMVNCREDLSISG